jgi:flagellar hook assembly protein FlgD
MRIDDDLYASAKAAGDVMSRSASQQITHWARIGRELEASEHVSASRIAGVLAGAVAYDDLEPEEQAVVRAEWTDRLEARRRTLDLAAEFAAEGRTWVEVDDDGRVVERTPAPAGERAPRRRRS